jgi:hypothetical protein
VNTSTNPCKRGLTVAELNLQLLAERLNKPEIVYEWLANFFRKVAMDDLRVSSGTVTFMIGRHRAQGVQQKNSSN